MSYKLECHHCYLVAEALGRIVSVAANLAGDGKRPSPESAELIERVGGEVAAGLLRGNITNMVGMEAAAFAPLLADALDTLSAFLTGGDWRNARAVL